MSRRTVSYDLQFVPINVNDLMQIRLLSVLATLLVVSFAASAQTVGVTFLNNSPEPALSMADIYISQSGVTQKGENIKYQEADNLNAIFIFSDLETTVSVAPGTSGSEAEKVASVTFTPESGASYMIIISGVGTPGNYAANPDGKSLAYKVTVFETPVFTGDPSEIGTLVFAGATDQNASDVRVRGRQTPLLGDAKFGDFTTDNVSLARDAAVFDLMAPGKASDVFASFSVNLASYSSEVVVMVLSGFKTPADNQDGPNLVLLAVLESGAVVRNELITGSQTASVQFIHNAADPQATIIDLWVNGEKKIDNIGFRKATGFSELAAGEPIVIGLAPATSKDYADTIKTVSIPALRPGRAYHFVVQGVIDTADFAPNPEQRDIAITVHVADGALAESTVDGMTEVRTVHGVTDAGPLKIRSSAGVVFANGLLYRDITPTYLAVEPASDTLWVLDPDTDMPIKGWLASFEGTKRATVLLASGFSDPAANKDGERFRLILVNANGGTISNMLEVDPPTVSVSETMATPNWSAYPNPACDVLNVTLDADARASMVHGMQIVDVHGNSTFFQVPESAAGTFSVPVSQLTPGVYFVRMVGSAAPEGLGKRIIIQR